MNTHMAEHASERLDAQIADALFGQPGMSKVDVANRLRELRGDGSPLLVDTGIPTSPSPPAQALNFGQLTRWTIPSTECSCCEGDSEPLQDADGDWVMFVDVKALFDSRPTGGEPNAVPNRLTDKALALKLGVLHCVAAEYQSWIEFHSAGNGDYDDFLRNQILIDGQAVEL